MVLFEIKNLRQWLRLTVIRFLSIKAQDRISRQNALNQVTEAMQKTRRILNIAGEVIEMEKRYILLRVEGIYIFLDVEPVFDADDPHLPCAIETDDLAVYEAAHKMLSMVAASLKVRLRIPDEESFLEGAEPTQLRVSNALDGKGIFWVCCGCSCLQDTEDADYNWKNEWPIDNGFCDFHRVLASGVVFETKCQKGMEIIATIREHFSIPFVEHRRNVIF